jgi:hypothetical protein
MKLQIQNTGQAKIVVQDQEGYTDFVMEVAAGQTESKVVTRDLVQRIAPLLNAMEAAGDVRDAIGTTILKGMRWSVLLDATDEDRAVTEGLAGLPLLQELQLAGLSTGTPATDVVAVGTGLLGGQEKATLQVSNAAGTAVLDFEAVAPGAPGNDISVVMVQGAGALGVVVTANQIEITTAAGGSTTAAIIAAVNGDADAKLLVQNSIDTAGTFDEDVAEAFLEGGEGPGVSLTAGDTALSLTEVSASQLTFDIPGGISTSGYIIPLVFRNGPHITSLSVPVVA